LIATTNGSSGINLSWAASTDNVGVTGYRVERCAGASCTGFTQIATPTGTSLADGGLAAATTYRYRVRAADAAGNVSAYSAIASATTATVVTPPSGTNVALASNGGVASASSTHSAVYAAAGVNNGERAGTGWGTANAGWNDATANAWPDWVQVDFNGYKSIDRVVVYTLQDNVASPVEPTDAMTFGTYGVRDFTVQGWNGSAWVTLASVSGNNLVKRTVTFAATVVDRIRVNVTGSLDRYSRITEIEAWGTAATSPAAANVALAANGGVASASSTHSAVYAAAGMNNGERAGAGWGVANAGWNDATANAWPDWVEVDFNGYKSIDRVVVYTLQDNFASPVEPTDAMTFSQYGVRDFTVQGWNGSAWVTLGSVSGNNLVKRTVTFAATVVDRIRVNVTGSLDRYSRITEIEAWGTAAPTPVTNVALAANGGVASASSEHSAPYAAEGVNNGERAGAGWGTANAGWNDATANAWPDWVEIDFDGYKSIDRVVVYTLQDNVASPVEPTDGMTFGTYGVRDFTVQGWNGSSWVTLASVSGNNLVKRTVTFAATVVDRIRVNVTGSLDRYSRITEIEAWGR
jgi:hypothetical protein